RYTSDDTNAWAQITNISTAADGTVWGVNAASKVVRYTWDASGIMPLTGKRFSITVGSNTNVWGVDSASGTSTRSY
ncbi:hypothetical protein C8F01DRAFT_988736, partial [Mycena amicta]